MLTNISKLKSEAPLTMNCHQILLTGCHEALLSELSDDVLLATAPTGPIVLKKINITILASEKVR